jgi:uncharacterized protein
MPKTAKRKPVNEAFLEAARLGDFDGVKFYLEEGANIETRDNRGRTAMHIAAEKGMTMTLEVLIEEGGQLNTVDHAKETPLMLAAKLQGGYDAVAMLISNGADITLRNLRGQTAFTMVDEKSPVKKMLRGAWLDALDKNPPDLSVTTSQDLHVRKPLVLKPAAPPQ